ncbi:MAG: hypothetical protein JJ896_15590 [Rhodothermales bacterium]|nr:hypothetical protein [Rhodothermales bacterium]MBO6781078.1 hypothetical protein [Rhodothermales bacterium]
MLLSLPVGAQTASLQPFSPADPSVRATLPVAAAPQHSLAYTYADLAVWGAESNENWDAVQDESGRVFVANGRGILVFDGSDWRVVTTPRATAVRSLAVGPGNRVFAGAQGEFGYLVPDSISFRFVSLSEMIPETDAGFGNVWTTRADGQNVYFQAPNHLFVWDGNELHTTYSEASYHTSFMTGVGLVLRERGVGLVLYEHGQTTLVPGGDFFADMRVFVLEQDGQDWFIGTRDHGFYRMREGRVTPVATEADNLLQEYWLYSSARSATGELMLGTLGAGLIGMTLDGKVTSRTTADTGLPDDHITAITNVRPSGFLATTQNNGVLFFESPGVSTRWGNLELDAASHVHVNDSQLFVAGGGGLEVTDITSPGAPTRLLEDRRTYMVAEADGRLYVGTDQGLQIWENDELIAVKLPDEQVLALAAYGDGVAAGYRTGLALVEDTTVAHVWSTGDVRSIAVSGEDIWYTTLSSGLSRLARTALGWEHMPFGKADGLPADDRLEVVTVDGLIRVYADDSEGIYKLAAGWFVRDEDLSPQNRATGNNEVWDLVEGPDRRVWIGYADRIEVATLSPRGYTLTSTPTLRYTRSRHEVLATDSTGALWFNRNGHVVRYQSEVDYTAEAPFEVILREVRRRRDGRLLFGGLTAHESGAISTSAEQALQLSWRQNELSIRVSAVYPSDAANLNYSWRVVPGQDEWSPWSTSTLIQPEDLWEGDYEFQVRARDDRGVATEPVTFRFAIAPPLWRTWWAYATYFGMAVCLFWFMYRYQVMVRAQKKAMAQARELEREKVYRRKLEAANSKLTEANRLKDGFLAKTSHELRTPITAILGFTNILQDEWPVGSSSREFLDIIAESSHRLMGALDDLLELAMLRAGTRELFIEPVNLSETIEEVVSPLRLRAGECGLFLRVRGTSRVMVETDRRALMRVLFAMVDNAVKFTEKGGVYVNVNVSRQGHEASLEISVQDTGIGINEEFLPRLFDEFQQESGGEDRTHNGTGLGLAILGGLIELLGGEIDVQSEKAVGSTFTVRFPVQDVQLIGGADRPAERRPRDPRLPGTGKPA